jgi:hypothetical protein
VIIQSSCKQTGKFNLVQRAIIIKRLEAFQKKTKITDHQEAKAAFIELFGPIMRETFCGACPEREQCDVKENIFCTKNEQTKH